MKIVKVVTNIDFSESKSASGEQRVDYALVTQELKFDDDGKFVGTEEEKRGMSKRLLTVDLALKQAEF